jgi:teichuronic acid biosynthesis glycosyltransferase TuaC
VLTDLWPSRSEPQSGSFVHAQALSLGDRFRHVVLVPRLVAPGVHRRVWGTGVHGWQRGYAVPPPPHRLIRYAMLRLPKLGETAPRALGARAALALAHERPALVHGHFLLFAAPAAVRVARGLGVPVVVTAHGSDVRMVEGDAPPRFRREMLAACKAADRVVVVDPGMVERLERLGVQAGKLEAIPMGADAELFHPGDRAEARAELGLDGEAAIILFVGRSRTQKGVFVLEEALQRLDGVRCYAAGPVDEQAEGITYLGVVESSQLTRWLAAADVVCLPSFAEGTPVSVAEALAAGRPVVASEVGGIPHQIEPGRNDVLVPPGDPSALTVALREAIERDWSPEEIRRSSEPLWLTSIAVRLGALYNSLLR